jgi:hypothetical protein
MDYYIKQKISFSHIVYSQQTSTIYKNVIVYINMIVFNVLLLLINFRLLNYFIFHIILSFILISFNNNIIFTNGSVPFSQMGYFAWI